MPASAWLVVPLLVYLAVVLWMTWRVDRKLPRGITHLPFRSNWPRKTPALASRRFALWNLPVCGGALGIAVVAINLWVELEAPHVLDLWGQLGFICGVLGLALTGQWLVLRMITKWAFRQSNEAKPEGRG